MEYRAEGIDKRSVGKLSNLSVVPKL